MAETIEAPVAAPAPTRHNFNPQVFHYVRKVDILLAVTLDDPSAALCGEGCVFSRTGPGKSPVARQGRVICPLCKMVYDDLPNSMAGGSSNG